MRRRFLLCFGLHLFIGVALDITIILIQLEVFQLEAPFDVQQLEVELFDDGTWKQTNKNIVEPQMLFNQKL